MISIAGYRPETSSTHTLCVNLQSRLSVCAGSSEPSLAAYMITGFIQASSCKIQGLFKDFQKALLLFSRTENL